MSSKRWFLWPLPFGDDCDPRCENELHNTYCFIFPVLAVILALSLIGFLRGVFSLEFLDRYSLDYQNSMVFSLVVFLIFFATTWKYQKKITIYFHCQHCLVKEKEMKGNSVHCGAEPILVKRGYFLPFSGVAAKLENDEHFCFRCGNRFPADQLGVEALG